MRKPRSRKEMIAYLRDHFRYDTMNSWNRATSYAACVKLHRLKFPDKETERRAWDLLQCEEAYDDVNFLIQEFGEEHSQEWQVGFNGRSNGYLVLYQGGQKDSGYKSRCCRCGQLNYKTIEETAGTKCGYCGQDARYNLQRPHLTTFTYPGKGLDSGEDFEEWDTGSLKSRVELVMEFDRLVENCKTAFINYCSSHKAEEETVMVPKRVMVAKELAA